MVYFPHFGSANRTLGLIPIASSRCCILKKTGCRPQTLPFSPATHEEIAALNSLDLSSSDLETLRRRIRSHARRDRKRWTLRQLEVDHRASPADRWKTIKRVRSKYQPQTQSVSWPSGRPSTATEKAEVLAQHLRDEVWKPALCPPPSQTPIYPCVFEAFTTFTMTDLHIALRRLKSRKAPGPDRVGADLYKLLPFAMRRLCSSISIPASCLLQLQTIGNWQGWL